MPVSKIATSAIMALSLVAVPALAQAAPAASKLSVKSAPRVGAKATKANEQIGGGVIIAILAAAAVIAGIVIAADSNDDPASN